MDRNLIATVTDCCTEGKKGDKGKRRKNERQKKRNRGKENSRFQMVYSVMEYKDFTKAFCTLKTLYGSTSTHPASSWLCNISASRRKGCGEMNGGGGGDGGGGSSSSSSSSTVHPYLLGDAD